MLNILQKAIKLNLFQERYIEPNTIKNSSLLKKNKTKNCHKIIEKFLNDYIAGEGFGIPK